MISILIGVFFRQKVLIALLSLIILKVGLFLPIELLKKKILGFKMGKRKRDRIIPHAPIKRLAKAQGIERIAEDAYGAAEDELADILAAAKIVAQHAGRQTVRKKDIKLVSKIKKLRSS